MQLAGLTVELRRTNRYSVSAPVHFWWLKLDGLSESCVGETRDISSSGVFVLAALLPPVGASLQLDVLLPAIREDSTGVRLHGEGVVVRCQYGSVGQSG